MSKTQEQRIDTLEQQVQNLNEQVMNLQDMKKHNEEAVKDAVNRVEQVQIKHQELQNQIDAVHNQLQERDEITQNTLTQLEGKINSYIQTLEQIRKLQEMQNKMIIAQIQDKPEKARKIAKQIQGLIQ